MNSAQCAINRVCKSRNMEGEDSSQPVRKMVEYYIESTSEEESSEEDEGKGTEATLTAT